ncbi:hypothetical protein [Streptomyces shenzhenensis]|uniref:hypothetical protein n=1 Tax=Streptomyces shenzhenensis TaxID=943815 RepID=UPI0033D31DC5
MTITVDAYLTDGLSLRNAAHAKATAARLQEGLKAKPEAGDVDQLLEAVGRHAA